MLPVPVGGGVLFYQIGGTKFSCTALKYLLNSVDFSILVVSYGHECGRPNTPSAYTNVQHFIDWIQEKLNKKVEFDIGVEQDS